MGDQANEIVAFDPGHPLLSRSHRTAQSIFERRQHPRQQSALGSDHEADPQADQADAMFDGPTRRLLSGIAQLMAEAGMRLGGLGQRLILPKAVPADRRTIDEHAGPPLEAGNQANDSVGHFDAGIENLAALGPGPKPVADRLARQIDDGIDPGIGRPGERNFRD
jgi:hypothetical protein